MIISSDTWGTSPPTSGSVELLMIMGATALTILVLKLVLQYTRKQADNTTRVAQETTPHAPSKLIIGTSAGGGGLGTDE